MYLGFDIGGTKMRLAVSYDGRRFAKPVILKTPKNFQAGMKLIQKTALELAAGQKLKAAAGGVPGVLNQQKTKLLRAPNLRGWEGKNISSVLKTIAPKVMLENDADLVGLGEALVGAGKGYDIVAYITISTGVGGVRIVNQQIDHSAMGFEPGHQLLQIGQKVQTLEQLISGKNLKRRYKKDPAEITDLKIWHQVARHLAYGLNNIMVMWSPEVIVIGGGLFKSKQLKLADIRQHLKQVNPIFPTVPKVVAANLGETGGLHGAFALLRRQGLARM